MFIRFFEINTNTYEGVYRVSDFINRDTGDFWRSEDANRPQTFIKDGLYQFDATDDLSELIVMVDEFDYPNRVTHVVASDRTRTIAYAVDSVEYINDKQVKYRLIEDNYLSHIAQVNSSRVLLTRSNDESLFLEHDVADLGYTRTRTVPLENNISDNTGKWVVYTFQPPKITGLVVDITVETDDLNPLNYETFTSLNDVKAKYPPISVFPNPNSISYNNKIVRVTERPGYITGKLYQFQVKYITRSYIKADWVEIPIDTDENNEAPLSIHVVGDQLTDGDIPSFTMVFPYHDSLRLQTSLIDGVSYSRPLLSAHRVVDIKYRGDSLITKDNLISKRVVTGIILGQNGLGLPTGETSGLWVKQNLHQLIRLEDNNPEDDPSKYHNYAYFYTTSLYFNETFKLSSTALFDKEPFKTHYLQLYGNNIPIKGKFSDKLIHVECIFSAFNGKASVWVDNRSNIIWSGDINNTIPYAIDKYQEFLAQNSTYATSKWVNTVLGGGIRSAKGAIGGSIAGGPAGALVGGLAGAVGIAQDIANYALQEKAMKDAPDMIKGDSSDYNATIILPFGVFYNTMSADTFTQELMKTEYYAKGFPTSYVTSIDNLEFEDNAIYGKCKVVFGRCVDMINNFHTTSRITERLRNGIVLLEDQYE